jgi:RimJ/RimL family protein N-acetyltransferase
MYSEIETDRMILREPRSEYAGLIFESFGADPEVTRFLRWTPHADMQSAIQAMAERLGRLRDGVEYSWIPFLKNNNDLIGSVSITISPRGAEIGYAFARSVWGQGLATEACTAVISWAKDYPLLGPVWASCDVDNHASRRVLEKAGLHLEEVAQGYAIHPCIGDKPRDCAIYVA